MRAWIAAVALAASLTNGALAAECTLSNARYGQPEGWVLQFRPLPADHAANMTSRFVLAEAGGPRYDGDVYQPNGYSPSVGSITVPCPDESKPEEPGQCDIWSQTVYAGTPQGIAALAGDPAAKAPHQVLFAGLGATIWYGSGADPLFKHSAPGDVFTLMGCDAR